MVTIFWLSDTALTGSEQERVAAPSIWTVQAPHWAMPQPYFVPVMPSCSRITHSSGVAGSTSTVWTVPLTLSLAIRLLLAKGGLLRPCAAECSGAVEPRLSNSRETGRHPSGVGPAPVSPHTITDGISPRSIGQAGRGRTPH